MHLRLTYLWLIFSILFSTSVISAESSSVYKLNQGDSLLISVWGEDTLQKEVKVLPDGSISFPLVGRIEVANTSAPEVEKRITEKLKVYLSDPQVSVLITGIDGNRVYIIGKVLKPGPFSLAGPTTVLQALSFAGGLDKFADLDEIKVLRDGSKGQITIPINYSKLIKGQNLESNILLRTGDTILVP
jgi:polysaccharide biosynthesis/export protein